MLSEQPPLPEAVQHLRNQIEVLTRSLSVSQQQSRRTTFLSRFIAGVALLTLSAVVLIVFLYAQVQNTVDQNNTNAVTNCQNANETREANRLLWGFVVDLSLQENPDAEGFEVKQLEAVRTWINTLYQSRDCSQLDKKYPIPNPPDLIGPKA